MLENKRILHLLWWFWQNKSIELLVNLQDGAPTTDADTKKQVEVDQTKKVENVGTLDQQNARVTEPFDDNTNDEEWILEIHISNLIII